MRTRTRISAGLAAAAFLLPGLMTSAAAQDTDQDDADRGIVFEEILVTARKREENLRDIPVAVSAMTAETIARAGISDVQDLALISPGLSYREGFGRATGDANNRPSIRGMSSILGNPNAAFFVDGVYVDGPIAAYSMENLERVEVIRGPQAATFGRGTFAGAVNFITRRPDDSYDGRFKVEFGDHDYSEITGYVSGPLIEGVLSGELNARFYDRGEDPGYKNLAPGGDKIGEEETQAIGAKLLWTPNENVEIYFNLNWSEDTDGTFAYGNWNGGDNSTLAEVNSNSSNTSNCFGPTFAFSIFTANRSRGYYCGEIRTPGAFWDSTGGLDGVNRETITANIVADFDIGEYTLTSVTGLTHYDFQNAFPAIYEGSSVSWGISDDNETFSQELRLTSPQDQPVRWTVGAYLYDQEAGTDFDGSFNPETTSPDEVSLTPTFDDSTVENRAFFGGIDWDVSDVLTLSAEVRYQTEDIKLAGRDAAGNQRFDGNPTIDFSATLPRIAFTWKASDTINIYGSIAEGNNPGDFNSAYYNTRFVEAERDVFVDSRGSYDESEVTTIELGMKGLFADGRVSLNAALYSSQWDKQALTNSDALSNVSGPIAQSTVAYITNAGESEVEGIELELMAKPTENWDITLSYALAQSEFKDYIDENWRDLQDTNGIYTGNDFMGNQIVDTDDPDGQVKGNKLPQTPENMINVSSTWRFPLEGDAETFLRLDYSHESKRYVQAANLAWIGPSYNLNARFGYQTDNWELSLWAKNLTDDRTPEVVTRLLDFRQGLLLPSQVRVSGLRFSFIRDFTVTAPRTREYGVTFTYDFGSR